MKTVVIGLSGGVDSSVAAYLLKEQGYNVIGLFMRNWNDASVTLEDECPWIEDSADALMVAEKLGIPFQVIDLSEIYKERIVDYMFKEYEKGRTPNPDVLCNREIKFDVFLNTALELGADFVATGHYAQREEITIDGQKVYRLLAGKDQNKDQSYFLCQLNQFQLSKALFPIGHLEKSEVRQIAKAQELVTAEKKDSQGLCFIGKVSLPEFLQQQLQPKKGNIIEIKKEHPVFDQDENQRDTQPNALALAAENFHYQQDFGKVVGEHQGAHYFTKGQRKGLGVGGMVEPLFVLSTDVEENIIYAGQGEDHPGLMKKALYIQEDEIHWVRKDMALKTDETMEVMVKIRYRQASQKATLHKVEQGMYISFEQAQKAITEGQFAVWYVENELIGSGVIS